MRQKKHPSPVPFYITAGVWLIYCLFFPLYKLTHFAILIVLGILAFSVSKKLFPGSVETIEEPEEPASTGDERIDALLRDGENAVKELNRLCDSIEDENIKKKIRRLSELTDSIFKDILEDKDDYIQIRRFADFFLPTTLKLLNAYDRMSSSEAGGENINGAKKRIEDVLDTTVTAYEKQLDALFLNQAIDIETDISVLEALMKKEGLAGNDFN